MKVRAWVIRNKSGKSYRSLEVSGYWSTRLEQAVFFSRIPDEWDLREGGEAIEVEIRTIEKKGKR